MLLDYGEGKQATSWRVFEGKAPMYARVYAIYGGKTIFSSEHQKLRLEKNHLYIFPTHVPYKMTTAPEDPIRCFYMHLDLRSTCLTHVIQVSLPEDPQMTNLIAVLRDAAAAQSPRAYGELLAQSFEALCLSRKLFPPPDPQIQRFVSAIYDYYRRNISVPEIAEQLGYSTEYFIRSFKQKLGISPYQYIISLRMSDAVHMLAQDLPIEKIAVAVGYQDGHSFCNAFHQYYGISPSFYRQNYAGYV